MLVAGIIQSEVSLKNFMRHFKLLSLSACISVLSISCSNDKRLTTSSSETKTSTQQVSGTIEFVNPSDGQVYQRFSVLQGDQVNISFKFTQDQSQNYQIGYSRKDAPITLNQDSISVNSITTGSYTLTLIARKSIPCRQRLAVRCDVAQN